MPLDQATVQSLISFLALVVGWSMIRPGMIRDYDNRRLPHNPTARLAVVLGYGLAYLILASAFLLFTGLAQKLIHVAPFSKGLLDAFKDQPALLAAVTLGGMLQFSFFRDIERTTIVWLHSRRHLSDDLDKLRRHLDTGSFQPSAAERQRNRDSIKPFGVYVTDESIDGVGLVTFHKWRKTSTLLRLAREWNNQEGDCVLSQEEMGLLADLETAHTRKTELAMTIVKMVDEVQQGGEASKALQAMLKLLSETPHIDRDSVSVAEAKARMIMSGAAENVAGKPLRLTGEQLKAHLGQIERYFEVEYQILLAQSADLVAKSVLLSGEKAPERLEQLSAAGIGDIGRIQHFNFDRILWLFLLVALGGFLVMYMGYAKVMTPGQAEGLARFALGMSFATLIGAIVGSRRRHARAHITPWMTYLAAGLLSGLIFLGINLLSAYIKELLAVQPPEGQPPFSLYRLLPWMLLPALTTVAIARLARMPQWPRFGPLEAVRSLYVRTADALCVTLVLYFAFCAAIALHPLLGLPLPPSVQKMMEGIWLPMPVNWSVQALGFLIGFFAIRDVRWAAHSTIVTAPQVQPETPVVVPQSGTTAVATKPAAGGLAAAANA